MAVHFQRFSSPAGNLILSSSDRANFKTAFSAAVAAQKTIVMCAHIKWYLASISGNEAFLSIGDFDTAGDTKAKHIKASSSGPQAFPTLNGTSTFALTTLGYDVAGLAMSMKTNINTYHKLYYGATSGTASTNAPFSADINGFAINRQVKSDAVNNGFGLEVEHFAIMAFDSGTDPFDTASTLNSFMGINGVSKPHSIYSLFPDGEYLAYFPLIDNFEDPINGYTMTPSGVGVHFHDTGMSGNIVQPSPKTVVSLSSLGTSYSGSDGAITPTAIYTTQPTVSKMDMDGTVYSGSEVIFNDIGIRSVPDSDQDWLINVPLKAGGTADIKPYSAQLDGFGNQIGLFDQDIIGGGRVYYRQSSDSGWIQASSSRQFGMIHAYPNLVPSGANKGKAVWVGTSDEGVSRTVTGAATSGVFTVTGHGFLEDEIVTFTGLAGGTWSTINSIPYYVENVTTNTFTVRRVANYTVLDASGLGTYTASSGTVARANEQIYVSTDLGATWTMKPVPYTTTGSGPTFFSFAANDVGVMMISEYDADVSEDDPSLGRQEVFDGNQRYIYKLTNWGETLSIAFDGENPPAEIDWDLSLGGSFDGIELKFKHTHVTMWSPYDRKFRTFQGDGSAQDSVWQFNEDGSFDQVLRTVNREQPVWVEPIKRDLDICGGDLYDYISIFTPSTGESYEVGIKSYPFSSSERGYCGITLRSGSYPMFAFGRTTEKTDAIGVPRKTELTYHMWDDTKGKMLTCVAAQFHVNADYNNASFRTHGGVHDGRAALSFFDGLGGTRYFDLEVPTIKSVKGFYVMPRRWNFDDGRSTEANGSITDLGGTNTTFSQDGVGIRGETCNKFTWDSPPLGSNQPTVSINRQSETPFSSYSGLISGATEANPAVFTDTSHGLSTDDQIKFIYMNGDNWASLTSTVYKVVSLTANTFSVKLISDSSDVTGVGLGTFTSGEWVRAGVISGASEEDPAVFTTSVAHGLSVGSKIELINMSGGTWSRLNNIHIVNTVPTTTTFSLDVDSSDFGTFSSGNWVSATSEGRWNRAGHSWEVYVKTNIDIGLLHDVGINVGLGGGILSAPADRWVRLTNRGWPGVVSGGTSRGHTIYYVPNSSVPDRDQYRLQSIINGDVDCEMLLSNFTLSTVPTIPMAVRNPDEDTGYYAAGQSEQIMRFNYDVAADLTDGWTYLFYMAPMCTDWESNGHPFNAKLPFLEFEDPDGKMWQLACEPWRIKTITSVVTSGTIASADNANPAVFQDNDHGLLDGEVITLSNLSGGTWSNLNGNSYVVISATTNAFSLENSSGLDLNSTSLGTFTAGTWTRDETARVQVGDNLFESDDANRAIIYTESASDRGNIDSGYVLEYISATEAILRVGDTPPVVGSFVWLNIAKVMLRDALGSSIEEEKDFYLDYENPIPMCVRYDATTNTVQFGHANTDTGQMSYLTAIAGPTSWATDIDMIHGSIVDPVNILPSSHHVVGFYDEKLDDATVLTTFSTASFQDIPTSSPNTPSSSSGATGTLTIIKRHDLRGRLYPTRTTTITYTSRGATVEDSVNDLNYLQGGVRIENLDDSEIDKQVTINTTTVNDPNTSKIDRDVTSNQKTRRGATIRTNRKTTFTNRGATVDNSNNDAL